MDESSTSPTVAAPPTAPGRLPAAPPSKVNAVGLVGLILCGVTAFASPTGIAGVTLCVLIPMGLAGLLLSLIGCFFKPRWYGIAGLLMGLGCILFWGAFFGYIMWAATRAAASRGLTPTQWAQTSMSCMTLVDEVEAIRASTGSLPQTFTSAAPPAEVTDPWGHAYRYTLTPVTATNPYGYTFISDGQDGIAGTSDDLDLIATHPTDGTMQLPSPPVPPAPVLPPSPPAVTPATPISPPAPVPSPSG
ncbi:MAG: hypothetical protein QM783_17965 [Phycisphaerales bacterium]